MTVRHPRGFLEADLVLLGVSPQKNSPWVFTWPIRATRLQIYLWSQSSFYLQVLDKVDSRRLIGLICEPEKN